MTGNIPDVPALARTVPRARRAALHRRRARLRRDRRAAPGRDRRPYGAGATRSSGTPARRYDNIVLVGGFSKAYSSLLAFLALPTWLKNQLKVAAPPYLYSGPSPTASLATVLAGFDVNAARGDAIRADLYRMTDARAGPRSTSSASTPPTPSGHADHRAAAGRPGRDLDEVGQLLWERGHLRDPRALPAGAPRPGGLPGADRPPPTPTRRSTSCSTRSSPTWPTGRCYARTRTGAP